MNGRTLRNVTRGKQDFALGECLCAAFMWVREWGAGVVRQSEWWVNGDSCVIGVMVDGNVWVQCMMGNVVHGWCAVWVSGNQIHNRNTDKCVSFSLESRCRKHSKNSVSSAARYAFNSFLVSSKRLYDIHVTWFKLFVHIKGDSTALQ